MDLITQLKQEEGTVLHAYQDTLGFWTIGTGRLIDQRKGGGITQAESDYLLGNDIAKAKSLVVEALGWVAQLNEPRQAVLIGMAFQMGIGGLLQFQQALAAIRDGHFDHAKQCMLDSVWAKQTPQRARRLADQISTGEWQ